MLPGSGARGKYEKQGHAATLPSRAACVNGREADPTCRTYAVCHVGKGQWWYAARGSGRDVRR
ncbi:hypothetical protein, partial [Phycicoccus elongatus]|uniref:hypothetical protein n=1 Tax=Phycicoccus elongatus TaxID=101689 RepID=UPI002BF0BE9B